MRQEDDLSHFARIRDDLDDRDPEGMRYVMLVLNVLIVIAIAYPVLMLLHIALASIRGDI